MGTHASNTGSVSSAGLSRTGIRNRLVIIVVVVVASLWAIYPPNRSIKLGLDLNGGVQLVLRVKTDQALRLDTQEAAARLRSALTDGNVAFSTVAATDATTFRVDGTQDVPAIRQVSAHESVRFDRVESAGAVTFRMKPAVAAEIRRDTVDQALHTIERRVNELGVSEPLVSRYTQDDEIVVQLPGVADVERAKVLIKSTAQLRVTLVERGPLPTVDAGLRSDETDLEVLPGPADARSAATTAFYVVHKTPVWSGRDLRDVRASTDEFNRPAVTFTLKPDAGQRFGAFTLQHVNRSLATVVDNRITSLATITGRIDERGQITGLSGDEVREQVLNFKSGALPADLEYVDEHTVGASLGQASIRSGVYASIAGLALVVVFMLAYYRRIGLNAAVSILLNLLILLALIAVIPVTMTLPGIAGLILTIGMGVDSNVLIFERIKEELAAARGARAAVTAGFDRVWVTIVDTHVTSLIAAALLFQFGTGPIRGFATTLTIGLLANVFTAVFASRTLFELALRYRRTGFGLVSAARSSQSAIRKATRFDVHLWRWAAFALSCLVMGAGAVTIGTRGLPLGIDFSGGTLIVAEFAQPVSEDAVRKAVDSIPGDESVQQYGRADERRFLIRLPLAAAGDSGDSLAAGSKLVTQALQRARLPEFQIADRRLVSAAIGGELQRRGIYATAGSIVAVTAYLAMRFRYSFAVGAAAATLHDILVTLACLSMAGYDLSLNVTAALLTIVGYSVNDTIVVFDRVRENMKTMRHEPLGAVVNTSVNQTLTRTIITSGATLLSVLALYLFGGEVLHGFAFTMLVGVISGTYSTVFIASAIATMLSGRGAARHRQSRVA
jgi:protein-export membrane protein SecD/preprotein translocase SecF subunit